MRDHAPLPQFVSATTAYGRATAGFVADDAIDEDGYAVGTSLAAKLRSEREINAHHSARRRRAKHSAFRGFHHRQAIVARLSVARFETALCGRSCARAPKPTARPRSRQPRPRRAHTPARRATADPGGDPPRPPLDAWRVVASVRESGHGSDMLCVLRASFTLPQGLDGGRGWSQRRFDKALDAALKCELLDVSLDQSGDFWAVCA